MKAHSEQQSTREARRQAGQALRDKVKRINQGQFDPKARKFDAVELMKEAHKDRVKELVPLKNARMAATPFTFFRGAAPLMAADLALLPRTGIEVQLCGDAHVQNLGAFGGGPAGHLTFDINDFDETITGPWEWDVKRMATSLVLAGRDAKDSDSQCKASVLAFGRKYRESMQMFSELATLELARYLVTRDLRVKPIRAVLKKAERATPLNSLAKLTERKGGKHQFKESKDPDYGVPVQYRVDDATAKKVLAALPGYAKTLLPERRHFFARYRAEDVAFRIVGTGSVGTRDYVVLMFGGALDDPMFLQLKQELPSAYNDYLPNSHPPKHDGERAAEGARRMLVQWDIFLGWATIEGRPYVVRQLRDYKGGIEESGLKGAGLVQYAEVCGELLAKGHARSGDPCMISGYLGTTDRFDKALVKFAVAYADQTGRDHAQWKKAIDDGKVEALKKVAKPAKQNKAKTKKAAAKGKRKKKKAGKKKKR